MLGVWKSCGVCPRLLSTSSALICSAADNQMRNVEFASPLDQSFSPQVGSVQVIYFKVSNMV